MEDLRRSAMANPERDAAATHGATPDTRTLVALLEGLMPLLLRIQEQSLGQQPFSFSLLDPANLMAQNAILDHQAAVSLVEDITADSLRRLSSYLETHAGQHPELQRGVGVVTQAAHCFAARDYGQAFALICEAYRAITILRTINPQLPPLRALASGISPSPPASIH
jgi:hypothetical protein